MRFFRPISSIGRIDDVGRATARFIGLQWLTVSFITVGVTVLAVVLVGRIGFYAVSIVIGLIGLYFYFYTKIYAELMRQFASNHALAYCESSDFTDFRGALFQNTKGLGTHNRRLSHVMIGMVGEHSMRLFNYDYTVQQGKSSHAYTNVVFEIQLKGNVPHVVIEDKKWTTLGLKQPLQRKLSLDGSLNERFTVYVPEDYEIETFQMLTEDIQKLLFELPRDYNIEFVDNLLYIYVLGRRITTRNELETIITFAKSIIGILAPLTERIHKDVEVMKQHYSSLGR